MRVSPSTTRVIKIVVRSKQTWIPTAVGKLGQTRTQRPLGGRKYVILGYCCCESSLGLRIRAIIACIRASDRPKYLNRYLQLSSRWEALLLLASVSCVSLACSICHHATYVQAVFMFRIRQALHRYQGQGIRSLTVKVREHVFC